VFAVTGGDKGTTGSLVGQSLEAFCKKPSKAVWVHLERAATPPLLEGRVIELVACKGSVGPWAGVMRLGGLDAGGGFVVPFTDLPMAFTITGEGVPASVKVSGTVPTPVFDLQVAYDLKITVQGKQMSITGTGSGSNGMFQLSQTFPGLANLPIDPAPKDKCP
jgi:hypothetical protein